jgi:hypothetical protein
MQRNFTTIPNFGMLKIETGVDATVCDLPSYLNFIKSLVQAVLNICVRDIVTNFL